MTPERIAEIEARWERAKGLPLVIQLGDEMPWEPEPEQRAKVSDVAQLLAAVPELLHALRNAQHTAQSCKELAVERKAKLDLAVAALRVVAQDPNDRAGLMAARGKALTARTALGEIGVRP